MQASEAALRADIAAVRTDLKADVQASEAVFRADVTAVRNDLKADIAAFRATVAAEIPRLDTRIERLDATVRAQPNALVLRPGGLMVVLSGAIVAALHYWAPS